MEQLLLIKRAKKGDKEALLSLIMNEKEAYFKLAYVMMHNNEEAMDAIEDMILILYEKIHKLRSEESFYSWSKTILVNCCKKQLKRRNKYTSFEENNDEILGVYHPDYEDKLLLERHLADLDDKHSEVLKLKYFMDYDNNTIAALLQIPVGTVKSRIHTGLSKLKISLGGEML